MSLIPVEPRRVLEFCDTLWDFNVQPCGISHGLRCKSAPWPSLTQSLDEAVTGTDRSSLCLPSLTDPSYPMWTCTTGQVFRAPK